jgi:hypothetical protein
LERLSTAPIGRWDRRVVPILGSDRPRTTKGFALVESKDSVAAESAHPEADERHSETSRVSLSLAAYRLGLVPFYLLLWNEVLWSRFRSGRTPELDSFYSCLWDMESNVRLAKEQMEGAVIALAAEIHPNVLYLLHPQLEQLYENISQGFRTARRRWSRLSGGLGSSAVKRPVLANESEGLADTIQSHKESQKVYEEERWQRFRNEPSPGVERWGYAVSVIDNAFRNSHRLNAWVGLGKAVGDYLYRLWPLEDSQTIPDFRPVVLAARSLPPKDRGLVPQLEKIASLIPGANKLNLIADVRDLRSPASGSQPAGEMTRDYQFEHYLWKGPTRNEGGPLVGAGVTRLEEVSRHALVYEAKRSVIGLDHSIQSNLQGAAPSELVRPRWDKERGELWYGTNRCRKYKRPARNQFLVLDEFEKREWENPVASPTDEHGKRLLPKEVLRQTIKDLVDGLENNCPITFRMNGTGLEAEWKMR